MLQQDSHEVTFHDTYAYFPEEEWKHLQEWQKELYRNVMKEIHQALISLVFSLSAKESKTLFPVGTRPSQRRHGTLAPTSDAIATPNEALSKKRAQNQPPNDPWEREERARKQCRSTEDDPSVIFIDHLGKEVGISSIVPNSGNGNTACHIKDEEEPYRIDHKDKRIEIPSFPKGDPLVKSVKLEAETHFPKAIESEQITVGHSVGGIQKTPECKGLPGKANVEELKTTEKGTHSRNHLWTGSGQEVRGETVAQFKSDCTRLDQLTLKKGPAQVQSSEKYKDLERNAWHANLVAHPPNAQINIRPFACTECNALFKTKQELAGHQKSHTGERPYQCTICGSSFRLRHHLIQHQRTHTGEKPYQCTECKKRFTLKGNLNMHLRTHMVTYEANKH
ncbi:zinc finger protein 583-like isoform X2 [Ambystoma mexicanum]|uniref:zinc finger protein 583-like isoform X2 n=1 Tax=Ambystoma mexicanum TaxID=8296 RepID=UPI0037E9C8AF